MDKEKALDEMMGKLGESYWNYKSNIWQAEIYS